MKIPISEIANRYSITILKKERASTDNIAEINGKISDLESYIRKGKEAELGLEKVVHKATQICEFNKSRVSYKNQMVSHCVEGFKYIKLNHANA